MYIKNLASLSIVDEEGNVIATQTFETESEPTDEDIRNHYKYQHSLNKDVKSYETSN